MGCGFRLFPLLALFTLASLLPVSLAESVKIPDTVTTIYPVTTGVLHPPAKPMARVLVWGSHSSPAMTTAIKATNEILQKVGMTIIERKSPLLRPQKQGPPPRRGDNWEAEILKAGKDVGVDHVVFVDTTDRLVPEETARSSTASLYDERVSVRAVGVETGKVVFEGTARWSHPIESPGQHIRELTAYAIARAICLPEKWEEPSEANNGRGRCRH